MTEDRGNKRRERRRLARVVREFREREGGEGKGKPRKENEMWE